MTHTEHLKALDLLIARLNEIQARTDQITERLWAIQGEQEDQEAAAEWADIANAKWLRISDLDGQMREIARGRLGCYLRIGRQAIIDITGLLQICAAERGGV